MPPLSLLIKPASSLCNLDCRYCFYHDIAAHRTTPSHGIMPEDVLDTLIRKALAQADGSCSFAFQGGEPTVAGLPFFRRVVALQRKYNDRKLTIHNAIQTNGLAIDREWAEFLAEHRFLVGVSLDGPRDVHDAVRVDTRERGTFDRVMAAIGHLRSARADFNVLSVVTGWSARHAEKIYRFLRKEGFGFLQFIPCLDPLGEADGKADGDTAGEAADTAPGRRAVIAPGEASGMVAGGRPFSLTAERYATFLITLFDLWKADALRGDPVSIRWFDNLAGQFLGAPPEACGMSGRCSCQFVVEADGGVYPCDFYVLDAWRAGSVLTDDFDQIRQSEVVRRFIADSLPIDDACAACTWQGLCRGGCRRDREPFTEGMPALNRFCSAYRRFFEHAAPGLEQVARMYANHRS